MPTVNRINQGASPEVPRVERHRRDRSETTVELNGPTLVETSAPSATTFLLSFAGSVRGFPSLLNPAAWTVRRANGTIYPVTSVSVDSSFTEVTLTTGVRPADSYTLSARF